MPMYEVKEPLRWLGRRYSIGERLELTADQAAAMGALVAPCQEPAPTDPIDALLAGNVQQVAERLQAVDAEQLQEIRGREAAGKNRQGVLKAIDERLSAAGNDGGNEE